MAGNPVGGISPHGFTYCDNIALGLFLQTEKLFGWKDGYFMMSLLQRDGLNLSQKNIGNQFTVQQVFGGPTFHWYELSYEQKFFDAHASVKLGRIAAGDDFAVSPLYWLYMNNGIDGNLQALPVNGRFSTYPNTVWGSRLKVDLTSTTVARLGVYQATPLNSINGLNWDFYPSNGVMLLGQYSWNPEFFHPSSASLEKKLLLHFQILLRTRTSTNPVPAALMAITGWEVIIRRWNILNLTAAPCFQMPTVFIGTPIKQSIE